MATRDNLKLATLIGLIDGLATRKDVDRPIALEQIRTAAGDRTDLLGNAAGTYRAAMDHPLNGQWWASAALWLCLDAGADQTIAAHTAQSLRDRPPITTRGINVDFRGRTHA